jgi:hypothetical protein
MEVIDALLVTVKAIGYGHDIHSQSAIFTFTSATYSLWAFLFFLHQRVYLFTTIQA